MSDSGLRTELSCPFCGSDLHDHPAVAAMLQDAHRMLEALIVAERGSVDFERLLGEAERFVGA